MIILFEKIKMIMSLPEVKCVCFHWSGGENECVHLKSIQNKFILRQNI